MCTHCGVLYKLHAKDQHHALTENTYSLDSWGGEFNASMESHGSRLKSFLGWCNAQSAIQPNQSYPDIGAGIGLLESFLYDDYLSESTRVAA